MRHSIVYLWDSSNGNVTLLGQFSGKFGFTTVALISFLEKLQQPFQNLKYDFMGYDIHLDFPIHSDSCMSTTLSDHTFSS